MDFRGYLDNSDESVLQAIKDVIATRAEQVDYPTLLGDAKSPRLRGYPRESTVAEKFHAMIRNATLNSRFKDYYDIRLLAENFEFDGRPLQKAIEKTFAKRQTEIPIERPVALTVEFAKTNQGRWISFLDKFSLHSRDVNNFAGVVNRIWLFLECPIRLSQGDKLSKQLHWSPRTGWR